MSTLDSASGHDIVDPAQEVADSGVDAVQVFVGTPFSPAHHTRQEPGFLVARHQRSAAVTLAGVLAAGLKTGAEHVPGDVELGVEATLLQRDPRQNQPLEDSGLNTVSGQAAPTGHGGLTDGRQSSDEGAVLGGKADGNHKQAEFDGAVELQHGEVGVGAGLVVVLVNHHLDHASLLLSLLFHHEVMFTFTGSTFLIRLITQ